MKHTVLFAAVIALSASALPAAAQSLSFGVGVTTDYISRGASQTAGRPALQPWVEFENNGFYVGAWASNVSLAPDSVEVDLLAGYRWSAGNTDIDVGYARYIYDNTGDAGGELYGLLSHNMDDGATLFAGFYIGQSAGGWQTNDAHVGMSMPISDRLTGSFTAGFNLGSSTSYGNIGVAYTVNDQVEVDFRLHAGSALSTQAVLSTAISF